MQEREIDMALSEEQRLAFWQWPAMRALCVQGLAFLLVQLLRALSEPLALDAPALAWAGVQGGLALLLAWKWLAHWWRPIQLGFAPAIVLVQWLQLPPGIFLTGFLLMALLFWSCFRTQVPYFPSNRASHKAVAALLPTGPFRFLDVGSGFGGMVTDFSRRRPESRFEGVEVAPLPWLASVLRARLLGAGARLQRRDYHTLDLGGFDVVYCYLSPAAMPALWRKARREMRAGSLLLSNAFLIPEAPQPQVVETDSAGGRLYVWRM